MYDYIKVDDSIDLPDFPRIDNTVQFQTKDFECLMDRYLITNDKRLHKMKCYYEEVPDSERPHYHDPDYSTNTLKQFFGCMRVIDEGWEDQNFHGVLNFYTSVDNNWYEYEAKFTDGTLVEIVLVQIETERR